MSNDIKNFNEAVSNIALLSLRHCEEKDERRGCAPEASSRFIQSTLQLDGFIRVHPQRLISSHGQMIDLDAHLNAPDGREYDALTS